MSFKSEIKKIEELGDKAVEGVSFGRDMVSGIAGIAILVGIAYLQVRFQLLGKIIEAFAESEQFKDPSMWWVYIFPFAFAGAWIFGPIYMIITMIVSIISIKNPYGKSVITLAYIKSIAVAMPFALVGLMFTAAGVCVGIACIINGQYAAVGAGVLCGLMGLTALTVGVGQIISNTLAYRDYISTGGVSFTPSKLTVFVKFATDNMPMLIGGAVFIMVPFALFGLVIATPDMELIGILMVILMGLIFAAMGAFIVFLGIKKFREFKETNEEYLELGGSIEDDYQDLSLK